MDDLRRRLDALANRGTPRGAAEVWAAARAGAGAAREAGRRRLLAPLAIAASVALVGGVAAAALRQGAGRRAGTAAPPLATGPARPAPTAPTTPTTAAPPTTTTAPPRGELAAARLRPFGTCTSFLATVKAKALEVVGPWGLPGVGPAGGIAVAAEGRAEGAVAAPPSSAAAVAAEPGDAGDAGGAFSGTNVQEPGIDEPDTIETDGRTIFAVARGALWAVSAGPQPRVLSRVPLEALAGRPVWDAQLLLAGDRLVVLATADGGPGDPRAGNPVVAPYQPASTTVVVDVGRPDAPRVVARLDFDGAMVSARLADGVVRVVLRSQPRGLDFAYPAEPTPEAEARAAARNRQVVAASRLANWLPSVTVVDANGRARPRPASAACAASYRPSAFAGFGMLTVVTLDPADPGDPHATSVAADGELVYASRTRLYVATNGWAGVQPGPDGAVVVPSAETQIHAFDITDRTTARYRVSGTVRGTVLNQFAMSEHDGFLRVATTDPADGAQSFVWVLANDGAALVPVGQVGGLGRGERIYAVRFIGPVGYVVTFRQVDPLYVVDLRDPRRPRLAGELKIEGYSAYLHPVGEGLLLGVGQDADEQGRRLGTQVSLFDVTEPANPRRLQKFALGPGGSPVEFDHHAFLWWPATRLALVPFSGYGPGEAPREVFQGAAGLTVDRNAIRLVRRIAHPASPEWGGSPPITRSAVVGDVVFTLSEAGLLASDLATLADRAWVPFPAPPEGPGPAAPAPSPRAADGLSRPLVAHP